MNTQILQKCVEELKKKEFSKEYVLGMLETLIAIDSPSPSIAGAQKYPPSFVTIPNVSGSDTVTADDTNDAAKKYLSQNNVGKI